MMLHRVASMLVLGVIGSSASVQAADWGDVRIKFVLDGKAPASRAASITKDQAFCGKHKIVDESLVVDADSKGIRDVIVHLYLGRDEADVPVHPTYEENSGDKIPLDNKGCRYEPHVALVRTSQTLLIGNRDLVAHNTNLTVLNRENKSINPLIPVGGQIDHRIEYPERLPVKVGCNIHPWMNALIVVQDHPYMASSSDVGEVLLKNVPAGKRTFQVYHERCGFVQSVAVDGKQTMWAKGRLEIDVKAGMNDVGVVAIPVKSLMP